MTDIQKARDVLAKWRGAARDGEWSVEADTADSSWLGRGTAGNPELLDAIDGLLMSAQSIAPSTPGMIRFVERAEHIAAAIIAADEWMSA